MASSLLSPEVVQRNANNEDFLQIILRWSLDDAMNNSLYANMVNNIPDKFPDVTKYYRAFRRPLIEETRAQVAQSLESVGSAPYISLSSIVEMSGSKTKSRRELRRFRVTPTLRHASWRPKPTDIVLLCPVVPKGLKHLRSLWKTSCFAIISSSEDVHSMKLDITAHVPMHSPKYKALVETSRKRYAVYLDNAATGLRIWDALNPGHAVLQSKRDERPVVAASLYKDSQVIVIYSGNYRPHGVWRGIDNISSNQLSLDLIL